MTTTVTLTITDAWLTDVADPTQSVHASFPERSLQADLDGDVRFYAGGRRRVITSARQTASFPLTLQLLTDAEVVTLTDWRGRVLLLRDNAGRRVFGTFLSLDIDDIYDPAGTLHNVSLTFQEISYSEAV